MSPKQTDISNNDINSFTKKISLSKSNNHQRNRKRTFFSNALWGILCLDFIVGGLYVQKRSYFLDYRFQYHPIGTELNTTPLKNSETCLNAKPANTLLTCMFIASSL